MADNFNFELVSPEEKLISESAFQVTIPGQVGEVGVRAGHMSLIVAMKPGIVTVLREQNSTPEKIFVAGGFADIGQAHVTVLAEQAIPVAQLNREKLESELANIGDDLRLAETDTDKARFENRKTVLVEMIAAIAA